MNDAARLCGARLAALLLVGLLPGCAGSSTTTSSDAGAGAGTGIGAGTGAGAGTGVGAGAAPISIQQLPDQFANAYCINIAGCCQTAGIAFDLATCKKNLLTSLTQGVALETTPNVKYDAAAAGRCVAAYASNLKSCKLDNTAVNAVCATVFLGTLPVGAPCTVSDECLKPPDTDTYCDMSSAGTQGICTSLGSNGAHGKQGDACGGTCTSHSCSSSPSAGGTVPPATCFNSDGLYCGSSQTCLPLAALGQPCEPDGCTAGTFCQLSATPSGDALGTCAATEPDGAPCMRETDCASGSCTFGTDGTFTGTCGSSSVASEINCAGSFE